MVLAVVLQVVLALAFAGAGALKVVSPRDALAEQARHVKFGADFFRFVGAAEVLGALGLVVGLWLRVLAPLAALGLAILMAGAVYSHVVRAGDPPSRAIGPAVLLVLLIVVVVLRHASL